MFLWPHSTRSTLEGICGIVGPESSLKESGADVPKVNRKEEILRTYTEMLCTRSGDRVTTAALAAEVGISESAIYRHFSSKADIIEALIKFLEETVLKRIQDILAGTTDPGDRCHSIVATLMLFIECNPGFARLLLGDALLGERPHLRDRMRQFVDHFEARLREVIRDDLVLRTQSYPYSAAAAASLIVSVAEGGIMEFVRSGFQSKPSEDWNEQWAILSTGLDFQKRHLTPD